VHYKRVDLAVAACNRLGRPLVVIGTGPMLAEVRRQAGPSVRVLGWQADDVVRDHFRRCRALLFCGEEDFGLTPVEAMAAGRPVIAFRAGGATETVLDGRTGLFFDEQTPECLADAILRFEQTDRLWPPLEIRCHARQFGVEEFRRRFLTFFDWCLHHYRRAGDGRSAARWSRRPPAQNEDSHGPAIGPAGTFDGLMRRKNRYSRHASARSASPGGFGTNLPTSKEPNP